MLQTSKLQGRFQDIKKNLDNLLQDWDNTEKYFLAGLGGLIILIVAGFAIDQVLRNLIPYNITLAAGRDTGESYILSDALAKIVGEHTNVKIRVCATDGTEDNINSLANQTLTKEAYCPLQEPTKNLEAELITAQADRSTGAAARIVTNLYEDKFQLVVNPQRIPLPQNIQDFDISVLRGKTIETPEGGGQRKSFNDVAKHFDLQFSFLDLGRNPQDRSKIDAVFRVRALGNREILKLIEQGWKLVPLQQAPAMKATKYPAYLPAQIPQGSYKGSPPIPDIDLDTIMVQRTLLARRDVPDWVVQKITATLNENRQEIKEAIKEIANDPKRVSSGKTFDPEAIQPLVDLFSKPKDDGNVQIHRGALAYYYRDRPSFIQENADFVALLLTIILLLGSLLSRLKAWRDRRKQWKAHQKEQTRKDQVDSYIKEAVNQMKLNQSQGTQTTNELTKSLNNLFEQQEKLNKVFQEASFALEREEISQEGFRSFSEAYKSAREVIEQAIEDKQRKIVSGYVNQVKDLLKRLDRRESPDLLIQELDTIRNQAVDNLIQDQIFSRESFRTFIDAHNLVTDAIERYRNRNKPIL